MNKREGNLICMIIEYDNVTNKVSLFYTQKLSCLWSTISVYNTINLVLTVQ